MGKIYRRLVYVTLMTVISLLLFIPSTPYSKFLPNWVNDNVAKIVLGLDLQGGLHLVLKVDQDQAVKNNVLKLSKSLEDFLKKENAPFNAVQMEGMATVNVSFENEEGKDKLIKIIKEDFPRLGEASVSGNVISYTLSEEGINEIASFATNQALEKIRNRIDKYGVTEPLIQRQGKDEVVVQLPGVKNADRAIALIGQTALLEFKLVDESRDPSEALKTGVPFGSEILHEKSIDPVTGEETRTPYLVKTKTLLTGDYISDARVAFDPQFNEPYVSITFDKQGSKLFEEITARSVNKRMAIILDGNVYSAPVIREKISGGRASISGSFTYETATDLAIVLREGALPAPVEVVQNITVGPSLGKDSIDAGISAIVIGALLVLFFMAFYYRVSGIIADLALVLNIVMLMGAMAIFNATLTLPGIAGILLTMGMGVDSNVLIFERIKEELRSGKKTPRAAINAGFDRAWWTILDAHVTTLITAFVLFQFGSGPIKGFAVTLSLGILINLFTAFVGSKTIFDILTEKIGIKKVSI